MKKLLIVFCILPVLSSAQTESVLHYGGIMDEKPYALSIDENNNLIIAGSSRSDGHGSEDFYLLKIDTTGKILSTLKFGGAHHDIARDLLITENKTYLLCGEKWDGGYGREDVFIMNIDQEGEVLWSTYSGGNHTDQGFAVTQTQSGFVSLGYTASFGGSTRGNFFLTKYDINGQVLWTKDYGTAYLDYGFDVIERDDQRLWLLGTTGGFYNFARADFTNHDSDILLIQTSPSGEEQWRITIGGEHHDWAKQMIRSGNDVYAVGSTQSYGAGSFDLYVFKISTDGRVLWEQSFGGENFEYGEAIDISPDQHLYLAGTSRSGTANDDTDIYVVKTDLWGNLVWERRFGGLSSDYGFDIKALPDGGAYVLGSFDNGEESGTDVQVLRLTKDGTLSGIFDVPIGEKPFNVTAWPNPAVETVNFRIEGDFPIVDAELKIFNSLGQLIHNEELKTYEASIKLDNVSTGVYFYTLKTSKGVLSGTLVKGSISN